MAAFGLVLCLLCTCFGYLVCQDTCITSSPGKQLTATSTKQFITSPGFPNNYTNNRQCFWRISDKDACELIRIEIMSFDVEYNFDHVILTYDSVSEFLQKSSPVVRVIPSNEVTVLFTTDRYVVDKGFNMSYEAADCICDDVSEIHVVATRTTQYITSPGYPYSYPTNITCRWNVMLYTNCSILRLEIVRLEIDPRDKLTLTYDDGIIDLLTGHVYRIPGISSGLGFQSDSSRSGRGFNISYAAVDVRTTNRTLVIGCQNYALLAEEQSKYIFSSKYPDYSSDGICEWMVFVEDPCLMLSENTTKDLQLVVEEFNSTGSTTLDIFQDQKKIEIFQESALIGRPLYFHVPVNKFVLISVRHSNEGPAFKMSYKVVSVVESQESSRCTIWIVLTSTIGGVLLITIFAQVLVFRIYEKSRMSKTSVNNIEMEMDTRQARRQQTESRLYVHMDEPGPSYTGSRRVDDLCEVVTEPNTQKDEQQSNYLDMCGSKFQRDDKKNYQNPTLVKGDRGTESRPREHSHDNIKGDTDSYEDMRDYINTSPFSKPR